ncbi:MAG: amidase [Thermoleophilia bacterium]|nr:amidase [Thermoleophilia bacterium]
MSFQIDPLTTSAAGLARAIKLREVTVTGIVDAHISRIEEVNPALNAVITPMFDTARKQAKAADERIEADGTDDLPPLFGVPITVKDCWPVEGVRFTAGSWFHRDDVADADAEIVKRLREAGAIILGKTNLPDMSWGIETVNPIFGRTRNPRSLKHSAGGSSGGEAAIIAAGGSPLGFGSDIGGSLRNPAANNGCVSLKPTTGRVPTDGHVPVVDEAVRVFNAGGPLARRVEDLALALSVLSGEPLADPPSITEVPCVANLRNGPIPVRKEVAETVLMAAGALGAGGMKVTRNDSLPLDRLGFIWTALLRNHALAGIRQDLGGGSDYRTIPELLRGITGKARISREALVVESFIRIGGRLGPLIGEGSFERLERHKGTILEAIGEGVLLCPLFLTRPSRHGATYRPLTQIPYTTPFNAVGMPAAIVPVRWTENGLPLAVQVVAREGADELVLAVAAELERVFGGWHMAEMASTKEAA